MVVINLYLKFLSSQLVCKKRGSYSALQQDPGVGFGGPGLWSRTPLSISQDVINMHIQNYMACKSYNSHRRYRVTFLSKDNTAAKSGRTALLSERPT